MNLQSRHHSQIQKLIQIFSEMGPNDGPLDRKLQKFFRKNKQFGSKDRKWTSAALYGYWRWFGWLQKIEAEELRLFCGYLLDGNEITPLIKDWALKLEVNDKSIEELHALHPQDLDAKLSWMKKLIPELQIADLNPEFTPSWPPELYAAFQERAGLWLRRQGMGRAKLEDALQEREIQYEIHPILPSAFCLQTRLQLTEFSPYQKGLIEVQDLHSQLVGHILNPGEGEKWLDLCAGAGGKALHLASLTRPKGRILGLEIQERMIQEARKRATRGFFPNLEFRVWDGITLPTLPQPCDGVLVDAPCSGSGTWRRAPDLRWRTNKEDITKYNPTQLELLQQGASQVKTGGILAYVTCSIFAEENQNIIQTFLESAPFDLEPFKDPLTGEECQGMKQYCPPQGDGIFIAKLRRQ